MVYAGVHADAQWMRAHAGRSCRVFMQGVLMQGFVHEWVHADAQWMCARVGCSCRGLRHERVDAQ
eukprot:1161803-Pelagomonas_calceolata.AAC.3